MGALPARAGSILEAVIYRGELPRGEVADVLGVSDRQARRVVAALTQRRVLTSETPRSPLHIAFPAELAGRWMPGLFPEKS
jgi:predicted ArsR family transcriptional regulator